MQKTISTKSFVWSLVFLTAVFALAVFLRSFKVLMLLSVFPMILNREDYTTPIKWVWKEFFGLIGILCVLAFLIFLISKFPNAKDWIGEICSNPFFLLSAWLLLVGILVHRFWKGRTEIANSER